MHQTFVSLQAWVPVMNQPQLLGNSSLSGLLVVEFIGRFKVNVLKHFYVIHLSLVLLDVGLGVDLSFLID